MEKKELIALAIYDNFREPWGMITTTIMKKFPTDYREILNEINILSNKLEKEIDKILKKSKEREEIYDFIPNFF